MADSLYAAILQMEDLIATATDSASLEDPAAALALIAARGLRIAQLLADAHGGEFFMLAELPQSITQEVRYG